MTGHLAVSACPVTLEPSRPGALDRLRSGPELVTPGGRPVASEAAARLGWLAEPCPERAEAEINPLVVSPTEALSSTHWCGSS